jgi:hypothetical protein
MINTQTIGLSPRFAGAAATGVAAIGAAAGAGWNAGADAGGACWLAAALTGVPQDVQNAPLTSAPQVGQNAMVISPFDSLYANLRRFATTLILISLEDKG